MISAANPKALVVPIWSGEGRAIAQWQPSLDAHCLIVGGQDIDRAVTIGELVTRFVDAGYRVWVGGGNRVAGAQTWPPRSGDESAVYATSLDQTDMLRAAHEEMISRYQASTGGERSRPPLMVVITDFSVLEGSFETIGELAQLARAVRIHLLIGNASPPVELLVGALRDCIRVRVPMDAAAAESPLLRD